MSIIPVHVHKEQSKDTFEGTSGESPNNKPERITDMMEADKAARPDARVSGEERREYYNPMNEQTNKFQAKICTINKSIHSNTSLRT